MVHRPEASIIESTPTNMQELPSMTSPFLPAMQLEHDSSLKKLESQGPMFSTSKNS